MVAVTHEAGGLRVLDRRRIVVIDGTGPRAKQPYHFVEHLPLDKARAHLDRCEQTAIRLAAAGLKDTVDALRESRHEVVGCAILQASGRALPELARILASHAMIHAAEGEFFRNVFAQACEQMGIGVAKIRERELFERGSAELEMAAARLKAKVAGLGKALGPPWTQDQKSAALAAWLVLGGKKRTAS